MKKTFPDMGSDEAYNPGIDLVVSKVKITRSTFAGERKIQIIPYIKNMWRGRTNARIKILLDGLARAEWIEDGIGPNEEKAGGALYVPDSGGAVGLRFDVVVDNNNAIPENNDHNNRCSNVSFFADSHQAYRSTVFNCPITGPHEPLI